MNTYKKHFVSDVKLFKIELQFFFHQFSFVSHIFTLRKCFVPNSNWSILYSLASLWCLVCVNINLILLFVLIPVASFLLFWKALWRAYLFLFSPLPLFLLLQSSLLIFLFQIWQTLLVLVLLALEGLQFVLVPLGLV